MASIRTAGLAKNFGDLRAVNEIDLDLPEGGVAGFVGPNGAGKSTTIRMLLGLITPTGGEGFGGASAALGLAGIVAACVGLVAPASEILAVGVFALIIFHLVLGWKVYILSRSPVRNLNGRDNERDKMSLSKA